MFFHLFDLFLIFENFGIFGPKKLKFWPKSEKTSPRYTYLDGFGKFLVIFCPKIFLLPLLKKKKKNWRPEKKNAFLAIFQKYDF